MPSPLHQNSQKNLDTKSHASDQTSGRAQCPRRIRLWRTVRSFGLRSLPLKTAFLGVLDMIEDCKLHGLSVGRIKSPISAIAKVANKRGPRRFVCLVDLVPTYTCMHSKTCATRGSPHCKSYCARGLYASKLGAHRDQHGHHPVIRVRSRTKHALFRVRNLTVNTTWCCVPRKKRMQEFASEVQHICYWSSRTRRGGLEQKKLSYRSTQLCARHVHTRCISRVCMTTHSSNDILVVLSLISPNKCIARQNAGQLEGITSYTSCDASTS